MAEGITTTRRTGGFTVLQNSTVYDKELSYAALGILAVLLARPDDAPKGYRSLMRPGVGQKSILSAFGELRAGGYRYQFYRHETDERGRGHIYTDTYIYDTPVSLEEAKRDHFDATGKVAIDVKGKSARAKAEAVIAAERAAAEAVDVEADEEAAQAAAEALKERWAREDAERAAAAQADAQAIHGASEGLHGGAFHGASLGDAHERVAQDKSLPTASAVHPSPADAEIVKKGATVPAQGADGSRNDATQPQRHDGETVEEGRARVLALLAERRAKRTHPKKEVASLRIDEKQAGELVHA